MDTIQFQAGLDSLARPVLPLVRLVQLLFLTGPFATVREVVAELTEPVDTVVRYDNPPQALAPYLEIMEEYQRLKDGMALAYEVRDEDGAPLPVFEAVDWWVAQQVATRELERINSLLCAPCGCSLCCVGPGRDLQQIFFSIPLGDDEIDRFPLPRVDTPDSRNLSEQSEPPLMVEEKPFYDRLAGLYRWQSGWSMILPTGSVCPHLTESKACSIYPERPEVCRRPQIFPYLIQRLSERHDSGSLPVYQRRGAILSVWDCLYVKQFQAEIAAYAELCELEPVFRENKA